MYALFLFARVGIFFGISGELHFDIFTLACAQHEKSASLISLPVMMIVDRILRVPEISVHLVQLVQVQTHL